MASGIREERTTMAYTIGSSTGKEIAKNMTVGSTYKASDGSTWKKQADGSVSVTHQGVTTNNAYKPTTSGGSSSSKTTGNANSKWSTVGSTSSGSSNTSYSGGSSGGSYTVGSSGGSSGSWVDTTGRYTSTGGDIGDYGINQMKTNAPSADVWQTILDRQKKAIENGTPEYATDALYYELMDYYNKKVAEENREELNAWLDDYKANNEQPTYEKPYDPAMEAMLNQILNREDFSYDIQNDPLYQQYSAMYQQEGDRAMRETMAEAAASAGGMNSYAVTAAQQANNYYASQLGNKIPELYQLAYEMYLQDKESMVQDLGLLQGMDATQYNRYRDTMNDYYADKNFAYGMYRDDVAQNNWEKEFAYNQLVGDRNFNYGVSQDAINNSWKEKDYDLEKAKILAQAGNYEGYRALGYTDDEIESLKNSSSYGSAYVDVFNTVKEMKSKGKSRNEIINFLNGISEEELNTVGLQKILSYLGI